MAFLSLRSQKTGQSGAGGRGAGRGYDPLKMTVRLREAPLAPDDLDAKRIETFQRERDAQTDVLLVRDRQIEYNIRMICGQQWNTWSPLVGRFVDVAASLSRDEKKWRQLPVVNKLLPWYVSTHTRLTENQPIISWIPGPDRIDSQLAEVLDTLTKLDWRRANMSAINSQLFAWVVMAGRGHILSRLDMTKGDWKPWVADAHLPIVRADGSPMLDQYGQPAHTPQPVQDVPIKPDGTPHAVMTPDGVQVTGPPHHERQGGITCEVYSPLQVRSQWGPQLWHQKTWHDVLRFLTPEQVYEQWGVEVEPDISGADANNMATLERVLYGSGFYGAMRGVSGASGWPDTNVKGPLCSVYQRWEAPKPFDERLLNTWYAPLMERKDQPGGREIVWTPKTVISDGPREVRWPYVSPINTWDFIDLMGRPSGTTPVEMLNNLQRSLNKRTQQIDEHAAVSGSPQRIVYDDSGIDKNQVNNSPTKVYVATRGPGPAIEWSAPPALSSDVYRAKDATAAEIQEVGMTAGNSGQPPTDDPSGVLVEQLRFDTDRYLGDCSRRAVGEYGRLAENWLAVYPIIYTEDDVITLNGDDNLARTIVVYPKLFEQGMVHVQPDIESMVPESRAQRQSQAYRLWKEGAWGDPRDPKVRDIFLRASRFTSYGQLSRPGGTDRTMAEQENGRLLAGAPGVQIAPWQDDDVHLWILEDFMKSPEFWKQKPKVQRAFQFHRQQHLMQKQAKAQGQAPPPGSPQANYLEFLGKAHGQVESAAASVVAKAVAAADDLAHHPTAPAGAHPANADGNQLHPAPAAGGQPVQAHAPATR